MIFFICFGIWFRGQKTFEKQILRKGEHTRNDYVLDIKTRPKFLKHKILSYSDKTYCRVKYSENKQEPFVVVIYNVCVTVSWCPRNVLSVDHWVTSQCIQQGYLQFRGVINEYFIFKTFMCYTNFWKNKYIQSVLTCVM